MKINQLSWTTSHINLSVSLRTVGGQTCLAKNYFCCSCPDIDCNLNTHTYHLLNKPISLMNAEVFLYTTILTSSDFRHAASPSFPTNKHIKITCYLLHKIFQEDFFHLAHFNKTRTIFKLLKNHSLNRLADP